MQQTRLAGSGVRLSKLLTSPARYHPDLTPGGRGGWYASLDYGPGAR
jgi:hypothetical protein